MSEEKLFNLDLAALKACMPAMSNEEKRYYLCGVHIFERDNAIIYEASNGHIAIRVTSDIKNDDFDSSGIDLILPAFIVKHLCKKSFIKNFGMEGEFIPCSVDMPRISIEMLSGLISVKTVDGTFPEIDNVIPKSSSITFNKINVDGKYMNAITKSISNYSGKTIFVLQFTGEMYGSQILIQSESFENWLGVLMPASLFDGE